MPIFTDADAALATLRDDYLPQVAAYLPSKPTDARLKDEIKRAESEAQRRLKVFLVPTEVFPMVPPTEAEIAALNGRPWVVEAGYDMEGGMLGTFQWASIPLRQSPILGITSVKFVYPTINTPIYDVPHDWIYADLKAGLIQFTPKPTPVGMAPSIIAANVLAGGSVVPQMVRVRYTAGLAADSPYLDEIKPLVMRLVLRSLTNFLPGSASISSDGLTQSKSFSIKDWRDALDADIAALKESIKGPVWGVL